MFRRCDLNAKMRKRAATGDGRFIQSQVQWRIMYRSEEHTSELQSQSNLVCRLLLEKKIRCPSSFVISNAADPAPACRPMSSKAIFIKPSSVVTRTVRVSCSRQHRWQVICTYKSKPR